MILILFTILSDGIEAYFKVVNGKISKGEKVKFMATDKVYEADEVGTLKLKQAPKSEIKCGDVGYIISGIKDAREVKVGDTITSWQILQPKQLMVSKM